MGRVWSVDAVAKNTSTSLYGSIVTLAESPLREGLLWVGTDDGLIQVSEDGGQNWRAIQSVPGIPDTTFISRVSPSAHDVNTVYVSFDHHKAGDKKPYVARSTDLGRTWTVITNNLPERGTVYVVIEDHKDRNLLFAGTEFGLYVSPNGGQRWSRIRGGLPTIQVRDLAQQKREDDLVVATFGRGFYILDDLAPLRALTSQFLAGEGGLLPIRKAALYTPSSPQPGWQGARFASADNPPFGAVISYYLKDALRTRRAQRQEAERAAARRNEDVFYPPWDSLRAEDREDEPAVLVTITDLEGRVVRRLTGGTGSGVQRVTWDLRYPPATPVTATPAGGGFGGGGGGFGGGGGGPFVVPGTYTVSLARRVNGVVTPIGRPQTVEVYLLDGDQTPRPATVLAFQQRARSLQRAMLGTNAALNEALSRVGLLERALVQTPAGDEIAGNLRSVRDSLRALQEALSGDPTAERRQESGRTSLMDRLGRITGGAWSQTLGAPTGTQQRQYEILSTEFEGVLARTRRIIETDLKRVEAAAEAAGAPWTSGRLPAWRP
jgi:hypothetical protein